MNTASAFRKSSTDSIFSEAPGVVSRTCRRYTPGSRPQVMGGVVQLAFLFDKHIADRPFCHFISFITEDDVIEPLPKSFFVLVFIHLTPGRFVEKKFVMG